MAWFFGIRLVAKPCNLDVIGVWGGDRTGDEEAAFDKRGVARTKLAARRTIERSVSPSRQSGTTGGSPYPNRTL